MYSYYELYQKNNNPDENPDLPMDFNPIKPTAYTVFQHL
jgi:hypothetical protein